MNFKIKLSSGSNVAVNSLPSDIRQGYSVQDGLPLSNQGVKMSGVFKSDGGTYTKRENFDNL